MAHRATIGAGGHLSRPPLTGAVADRIAAIAPSLFLIDEGGGQWALCEHFRAARPTGCIIEIDGVAGRLSLMEDAFDVVKRYDRLDAGEIESDIRRMRWYHMNGTLLDEIDRHNERVEEGHLRDAENDAAGRAGYYMDGFLRRKHFGMPGLGAGIGGAAGVVGGRA